MNTTTAARAILNEMDDYKVEHSIDYPTYTLEQRYAMLRGFVIALASQEDSQESEGRGE